MPLTEEERKQRKRESDKKYREKNKEKVKKWHKKYNNTDKGIKSIFKKIWKLRGVIWKDENEFESIWEQYTTQTHCEFCNKEFSEGSQNIKCLDHDHNTGKFRFILCWSCNIWRISD